MSLSQPAILQPIPSCGRSLSFRLVPEVDPRPGLCRLAESFAPDGEDARHLRAPAPPHRRPRRRHDRLHPGDQGLAQNRLWAADERL